MGNYPLFINEYTKTSRIIYTPSVFARTSLLYLQEVGTLQALRAHTSKRSGLSSYLFFVVVDGAGKMGYGGSGGRKAAQCGFREEELRRGDCVFIDCMEGYRLCSSEKQLWTLKWVHFNGFNMEAIYRKYLERGGRFHFTPGDMGRYVGVLEEIYGMAASDSYVRDMEISAKLTNLLTMLMEDAWAGREEREDFSAQPKRMCTRSVKEYIDGHFREKLSLEGLARAFFIDKHYLAKVFKEQYGITVNHYILQVRITKAKDLLRFSTESIEAIGGMVGIPDPNYFSRSFKKVEGISPGEYRKMW